MKILQNSTEPIYRQIANQYRDEILKGNISKGEFLPSVRELAQELKISVITTMKAYEVLEGEGLITAIQGKGYLVNPQNTELIREQLLRIVEDQLQKAINASKTAGLTDDELIEMLNALLHI